MENNMEKKKVLVIFGGCSTEYEVSLQSSYAVINAINKEVYDVLLLGITKDGRSYFYEGDLEGIPTNVWEFQDKTAPATISMSRDLHGIWVERNGKLEAIKVDVIFPVLHGKNGEDGTLQGICEMAGIPCVGCDMSASVLGMDKNLAHFLVGSAGIRVPKSIILHSTPTAVEEAELYQKLNLIGYPLFVKPVRAGSSFGITKVTEQKGLLPAIQSAFLHDREVVIEEGIDGFEVGCAIIGNKELTVGRVDEIELSDGFFDYTEKYTLKTSKIHNPARISQQLEEQLQETAKKIYRVLGCKDYVRVDMFLTKSEEIVFNEVNTIPGFTSHSRYPNMLKGVGISFPEIVERLLQLALGEE